MSPFGRHQVAKAVWQTLETYSKPLLQLLFFVGTFWRCGRGWRRRGGCRLWGQGRGRATSHGIGSNPNPTLFPMFHAAVYQIGALTIPTVVDSLISSFGHSFPWPLAYNDAWSPVKRAIGSLYCDWPWDFFSPLNSKGSCLHQIISVKYRDIWQIFDIFDKTSRYLTNLVVFDNK